MRKLLLLLFFVPYLLSCSTEEDFEATIPLPVCSSPGVDITESLQRETLRILDIGNSYSLDCTVLLKGLLRESRMDNSSFCFYTLSRGGASFRNWYWCYEGFDTEKYYLQKMAGDYEQNVRVGEYQAGDNTGFLEVLSQEWDIIILHQYSAFSNDYNKWNTQNPAGYLYELVTTLQKYQPKAAFAFYLVHSYAGFYNENKERASAVRWENIVNTVKQLQRDYPVFQKIIPYGTAIQSLRTSSYSKEGELTRDGTHLGYGLARYAAACTLYESLFAERLGKSVLGNGYRYACTSADKADSKYPDGMIDVTDENAAIAQTVAVMACADPEHIYVVK